MPTGDDADKAQDQIEKFNESALNEVRKRAATREAHHDFDGEHCIDCLIEIPLKRLEMGRIRCVDCQSLLEKEEKRNRA